MFAAPDSVTGPLVALAVMGLLAAGCRWAFGSPRRQFDQGDQGFGLLLPVRVLPDEAAAAPLLAALAAGGVRATLAPADPGFDHQGRPWPASAVQVLVFASDLERARGLSRPGPAPRTPG